MLETTDELLHKLQSAQSKDMGVTQLSKSGNDVEVRQTFATTSLKFHLNRTHLFATFICIQLSTII